LIVVGSRLVETWLVLIREDEAFLYPRYMGHGGGVRGYRHRSRASQRCGCTLESFLWNHGNVPDVTILLVVRLFLALKLIPLSFLLRYGDGPAYQTTV